MLAPDSRFAALDSLTGAEFERALVELFELMGYDDVRRIGGYDKGADITFVDDGKRVAVQAKRQSSSVGIAAIRQLVDGIRAYDCVRGIAVTNSFFTERAIDSAERWGIELWDRRVLAGYVNGEPPEIDATRCAECGARVTAGVRDWCVNHPARYDGNVYCRRHQARSRRALQPA